VKSYLVSRRTGEIGIRMALGAKPNDVMRMIMRESAGLTLAGLAIGIPVALMTGRILSSILYDVSGFDPLVFLTAPLLLAASSLFASYAPARRATRVKSADGPAPGLKPGPAVRRFRIEFPHGQRERGLVRALRRDRILLR